jgi:hypothetical protein
LKRASSAQPEARVAYIISAYQRPEMLVRLIERLDAPGTTAFVHVDAKSPDSTYRAMTHPLAVRERVHFLPRHVCHWGDFGHVRASLAGLEALVRGDFDYDYVVLLTGQDYPLASNARIAEVLGRAEGAVFLDAEPFPHEGWTDGGWPRFRHRHFRLAGVPFAFPGAPFPVRALNAGWWQMARWLRLDRTLPQGLEPWGGSSYWMLPADCARYVVEFARRRPEVVRFFETVYVPDEMFFQTILMNSPHRDRVTSADLRYIDWDEGGDSPLVLTRADLPKLLATSALFARKFDATVDAGVLDELDRLG